MAPMACAFLGVHLTLKFTHNMTPILQHTDATGLALVATWLACCSLGAVDCILDRLFGRITRWVAAQTGVLEGRQGALGEGVHQGAHPVVAYLVAHKRKDGAVFQRAAPACRDWSDCLSKCLCALCADAVYGRMSLQCSRAPLPSVPNSSQNTIMSASVSPLPAT